jgi:hypothetical protein
VTSNTSAPLFPRGLMMIISNDDKLIDLPTPIFLPMLYSKEKRVFFLKVMNLLLSNFAEPLPENEPVF